ncbi:programmed cell death protein 7 [Chelonus insularis]|uniref:programmed cell death protein 7 n=1 Tax=Chelonus insularis TaxID=460826 RepID=UPI00158B5575|nr:programmed cell death protein 7-like [Chelonus insularis]
MYNSDFSRNSPCDYNMLQFYSNSGYPTPTYQQSQPPNVELINYHENKQNFHDLTINQRIKDAQFITNFIDENTSVSQLKRKKPIKRLGIAETKKCILLIDDLTKSLKELISSLENEIELSEEQWHEKMNECYSLKSKIEELSKKLDEAEKICSFEKLIEKRKKKRVREKNTRNKWQATKLSILEKRSRLHTAIDAWISEKQNVIEREKQEESFLKDADMILSDIRGKKSDARKYLAILNELRNLRDVKAKNARARGEKLSSAADQSFENIIVQLTEQWSKLDREYAIEEQGLKAMLKNDKENVVAKRKKNNCDDWEVAIFGRKLTSFNPAYRNINDLVMTRFLWDRYIDYKKGSRIPIGWVMPSSASSSPWERYLKQKK